VADAKITALSELTAPQLADLLAVIDDPAGTPITKKITLQNLLRGGSEFTIPGMAWVAQNADSALAAASGVQSAFDDANDALTILANTKYFFDGKYIINTGTTTHTTAMAFALTTATVLSFEYTAILWSAAANTISTTQSTTHVTGVASKVLNATSTAVYTIIDFSGYMEVGTGGTITPQINFSANPTGTNLMKRGSYIRLYPIGADTLDFVGSWA
jgi:hypothetical protein